jgi:hypothetical protein
MRKNREVLGYKESVKEETMAIYEDVFWDIAPCSLVEVTDVSEVLSLSSGA